jgi:hypothetical protein
MLSLFYAISVIAVWMGRPWGFWVGVASVFGHLIALIMFISDSAAIAIFLIMVDLAALFSLVTTAGEHRPRF